ncbi:MAG: hypothetical protein Q6L58_04610 [Thermostichales cyanobacterium BF3_bins_165]
MPKKPMKSSAGARRSPENGVETSSLPRLLAENAVLSSKQQLLLMYSNFQADMPSQTPIATWVQSQLKEHGMPSLLRFGPRHKPQVFRRDEFAPWFQGLSRQS